MKTIYVVRHGQTYMNLYTKMQGWSDTPLTQKGIDGAKKLSKELSDIPFDVAITSDLKRASDTCKIIVDQNINKDNLQIISTPYFREQFYGYLEGLDSEMAWRMAGSPHGYQHSKGMFTHEKIDTIRDWCKEADPFKQAEDSTQYWKRVMKGLTLISNLKEAKTILLVTHGFTIRSIVNKFASDIDVHKDPRNSSFTKIQLISPTNIKVIAYDKVIAK